MSAGVPCPYCGTRAVQILETRDREWGYQVRRRRHCAACLHNFTTVEEAELPPPGWQMARKGGEYPEEPTRWQYRKAQGGDG